MSIDMMEWQWRWAELISLLNELRYILRPLSVLMQWNRPPSEYVKWNRYSSELGSLFKAHNELG
jgi:hypothetical protein